MANTKKTTPTSTEAFDISKFYSRKNEEDGVWFEPYINGVPSGIELCVIGQNSSLAWVVNDEYNKGLAEAREIKDLKERAQKIIEVAAKRYAGLTIDIRAKSGAPLTDGKQNLTKENLYDIMKQSPSLQDEVYRFYNNSENFLERQKND